jgi:FAD-linked oxidoreductase
MADEELRRRWRNWSGEQRCRPLLIQRPRTREGLIADVIAAHEQDRPLKVAGAGHSFSAAALTDGVMLDLGLLDRVLEVDRAGGLVKVEAGITLHELNRRLDQLGLALENLGDIDRQTIAGSISTGTHGTGARFRNLSSQVEAIEIVAADGTLHAIDGGDADLLRAARVGLGALGAIYSVTLRTVTNFRVDRTDRPRPLGEVLGDLDRIVADLDHFEFYVFPHTETALCRESTRTQAPAQPPSPTSVYAQEVMVENWVAAAFVQIARRVPSATPALSRLAAAGTGKGRKLDASFRVYASERHVRFTEMEYAIPREHAREAVERVLSVAARPELAVCFPIEVRFVAGDDAMLSPAHGRDSAYIAVHHDHRGDWQPYFDAIAAVMADYGGRPHWGKRHSLSAIALADLYPRFEEFKAIRAELDPGGSFANPYLEQVLGPVAVAAGRRRKKRR